VTGECRLTRNFEILVAIILASVGVTFTIVPKRAHQVLANDRPPEPGGEDEDERKKNTSGDVFWKTERAALTVEPPLEAGSRNFTFILTRTATRWRRREGTRGLTIRRLKSHWLRGETSGYVREPLRCGVAGRLAGRQTSKQAAHSFAHR